MQNDEFQTISETAVPISLESVLDTLLPPTRMFVFLPIVINLMTVAFGYFALPFQVDTQYTAHWMNVPIVFQTPKERFLIGTAVLSFCPLLAGLLHSYIQDAARRYRRSEGGDTYWDREENAALAHKIDRFWTNVLVGVLNFHFMVILFRHFQLNFFWQRGTIIFSDFEGTVVAVYVGVILGCKFGTFILAQQDQKHNKNGEM
jgi:hypothetical protein